MAAAISAVLVGAPPPPACLTGEGKQRRAASLSGWMPVECSSRPTKKGTAHHMKTRPKKTQPWDVKRKGPTLYPSLPPLPPDWTFADDDGAAAAQQADAAASETSLAVPATAVAP